MEKVKTKKDYVDDVKIGQIVAFKIIIPVGLNGPEEKALSGMIKEIRKNTFIIETKNGTIFNVKKDDVIWVKTGKRFPKGVYLALKGKADINGKKRDKRISI